MVGNHCHRYTIDIIILAIYYIPIRDNGIVKRQGLPELWLPKL